MEIMSFKDTFAWLVFGLFMALEAALLTNYLGYFGPYLSPVLYVLAGVGQGALAIWMVRKGILGFTPPNWMTYVFAGLIIATAWIFFHRFQVALVEFPIGPYQSDVIPSLQMYVQRLLLGETVYSPLVFPSWTVLPTYFPMMWLPYVLGEWLQVDYRWVPFILMLAAIVGWGRKYSSKPVYAFGVLLLMTMLLAIVTYKPESFGHAVELTPTSYYYFLCLGLLNAPLVGLAIGFCLMSRYAISFWLLLYLVVHFHQKAWKNTITMCLYVGGFILMVYIIPFLAKDPSILTDGLAYYKQTATDQWKPQSWQSEGDIPHHLNQGLSFSIWFYSLSDAPLEARLSLAQKVHALMTFGSVLIFVALYFLRKAYKSYPRLFLMAALKIFLVLFYGFIHVPFHYLYMLPLLVSVPLFLELNRTLIQRQQ